MQMKQISVFLENQPGRLKDAIGVLSAHGINLRALSLAETSDYGVLRLIVDDPEACRSILKENDFTVGITDVVAVEVKDEVGGLSKVLETVYACGLNIEYMYAFVERYRDNAVLVFRFDSAADAAEKLKAKGLSIHPNLSFARTPP